MPTLIRLLKVFLVLVTLTEPIERMMQSSQQEGGKSLSHPSQYISSPLFWKKTANSTDSNKVDPEKSKKKKKNYGILDYYKFLSAKS